MNVTPQIVCCEFMGMEAKVARSSHEGNVGIRGKVVGETRNTFSIFHQGKRKMIPKDSSVFHFKLSDSTVVEIEGKLLVGTPENRLKKSIRRLW
jgi:ribonuclease P protein subunit POP4